MKKSSWTIIIIATIISIVVLGISLYKIIDNSYNKIITITIDYGYGNPVAHELKVGSTLPIEEKPTRDGFAFDGWYKDADFQIEFDPTQPTNNDIKIYAKWIEN